VINIHFIETPTLKGIVRNKKKAKLFISLIPVNFITNMTKKSERKNEKTL
jgi:hypothetical protein